MTDNSQKILTVTKKGDLKIEKEIDSSEVKVNGVSLLMPVGTIIAAAGTYSEAENGGLYEESSDIPPSGAVNDAGWMRCDGSQITDADSPLLGRYLPDLTENCYAAGSSRSGQWMGENETVIELENLPEHHHGGTSHYGGSHVHSISDPGHTHTIYKASEVHEWCSTPGTGSHQTVAGSWDSFYAGTTVSKYYMNSKQAGITINTSDSHTHSFTTAAGGGVTVPEPVDNRPNSFSVIYLMKVK